VDRAAKGSMGFFIIVVAGVIPGVLYHPVFTFIGCGLGLLFQWDYYRRALKKIKKKTTNEALEFYRNKRFFNLN